MGMVFERECVISEVVPESIWKKLLVTTNATDIIAVQRVTTPAALRI
jgi:hypothetical protein